MRMIPIHQIPKIFNNSIEASFRNEGFLTLGCHFAIYWSRSHSTTTFVFTLVVAFCSLCCKMPMESFIIFTFMDWQLWHWRAPLTSGKAPKFALIDNEIMHLFQVCSQQSFHNIHPTLQHHFESSLTHTMPFLPIWETNEGPFKSKDARASAKNTNNSMSKLCRYCIHEESYYEPKLLYIAKKKTQTKTPPSPCARDTHMWRKEGRVDRFLKHKI